MPTPTATSARTSTPTTATNARPSTGSGTRSTRFTATTSSRYPTPSKRRAHEQPPAREDAEADRHHRQQQERRQQDADQGELRVLGPGAGVAVRRRAPGCRVGRRRDEAVVEQRAGLGIREVARAVTARRRREGRQLVDAGPSTRTGRTRPRAWDTRTGSRHPRCALAASNIGPAQSWTQPERDLGVRPIGHDDRVVVDADVGRRRRRAGPGDPATRRRCRRRSTRRGCRRPPRASTSGRGCRRR